LKDGMLLLNAADRGRTKVSAHAATAGSAISELTAENEVSTLGLELLVLPVETITTSGGARVCDRQYYRLSDF